MKASDRVKTSQGRPRLSPTELISRFWSYVQKTEGCWLWTRSTNTSGYGVFNGEAAHRFSYFLAFGEVENFSVLHTCDNPLCVNPDHLFKGTALENARDCRYKGRDARSLRPQQEDKEAVKTAARKQFGINLSKLRVAAGLSQKDFAAYFSLHYSTCSLWETGHTTPNFDVFVALPSLLKCDFNALLADCAPLF